jgi:hypothetical protein
MPWRLFGRRHETEDRQILLGCLLSFIKHGHEDVSLPEVLEGVSRLREVIPLAYEFSKDFLYSGDLFADIAQLEEDGYLRRHEYAHDGLLPKSYVTLTLLGRGTAERTAERLGDPIVSKIDEAVENAIAQHREYWRLYPRM